MSQFRLLVFVTIVATAIAGCVGSSSLNQSTDPNSTSQASEVKKTEPFSDDDYASVLQTYVNDRGLVNYQALQKNRQALDRFNRAIAGVAPSTYAAWSEKEKLAFLFNAYNALTLQSIIDEEPIKSSIRDIPGVWKWRKFKLAGQEKTLDNIEHDMLRVDFDEPRLHVALVCAAMSCPPLLDEPYRAEKLDEQLEERVKNFIASPHGFRIDRAQKRVYLSSIFKWYGEDWKKTYGVEGKFTGNDSERAVLNFISHYLNQSDRDYLAEGDYEIAYLDYDWSLNRQ